MIHLTNFTEYKPDSDSAAGKTYSGIPVLFLRSDNGIDWYQAQANFKDDTMKFVYDSNNVIVGHSIDASTLVPYNCSVVEMSREDIPEAVSDDNTWQFIDGKIVPRVYSQEELIAQAERKKAALLSQVRDAIAPLQDAVDLDEATEEEIARLLAWKKYRVLLMRVKPEDAPNIQWPNLPA